MTARRIVFGVCALALVVVVALGVREARRESPSTAVTPPSAAQVAADLRGSPAPLASLHDQGGSLLAGGSSAFAQRLRSVRGWPVVVNKWASWCGPCKAEFPVLARVAAQMGRSVAFIGVDSSDGRGSAQRFLRAHPLSYPSFFDPAGQLGTALSLSTNFPVTIFYDAAGRQTFIHQGGFYSVAQLVTDIHRYALAS